MNFRESVNFSFLIISGLKEDNALAEIHLREAKSGNDAMKMIQQKEKN